MVAEGNATRYPCTTFSFDMSINNIPIATCVVNLGDSILNPGQDYKSPEDLMVEIQEHDVSDTTHSLRGCTIYEQNPEAGDIQVFKGYITAAHIDYGTGGQKSRMAVHFTCMGLTAQLLVRPYSSYIDCALSNIVNRVLTTDKVTFESAMKSGDNYSLQLLDALVLDWESLSGATIVEKLAVAMAVARGIGKLAGTNIEKFTENKDSDIMSSLGGATKLRMSILGKFCDYEYDIALFTALVSGLRSASIWDTVLRILTSSEFALQLMPRWSCDSANDFKTEIMPVTAWKPRDIIHLTKNDISIMSMGHDSLYALNMPDVVFANFGMALSYFYGDNTGDTIGVIGVAAKDENLEKTLRSRSWSNDLEELLNKSSHYRVQEFMAPKWLMAVTMNPDVVDQKDRDNTKDLAVESQSADLEGEQRRENAYPQLNKPSGGADKDAALKSAWAAADTMAKTLFLHYYMANDTVNVMLQPDLRFGLTGQCLENSLGDTVEIDLTGAGVTKSKISVKGVLRSVSFGYTAGNASEIRYSIILERVRIASAKVPELECPIYSVGQKIKGSK